MSTLSPPSPPSFPQPSRTLAILTSPSSTIHRLGIESILLSSGFDILLSRSEEWSLTDDYDFLEAFLRGHEDEEDKEDWIRELSRGPIFLMVLQRDRAVQTWLDLLGPLSVDGGEQIEGSEGSKGLRSRYGERTLYGSLDADMAERQIAICAPEIASEQALQKLEEEMRLDASFVQEEEEEEEMMGHFEVEGEEDTEAETGSVVVGEDSMVFDDEKQAFDKYTGEQIALEEQIVAPTQQQAAETVATQLQQRMRRNNEGENDIEDDTRQQRTSPGKTFKARPVPASLAKPAIEPRLSRAAALRMGVQLPAVTARGANGASPQKTALQGPVGISGLPKSQVELPKSLAQPTVQPRANRASLVRMGLGAEATALASPTRRERREVDFSNTPGHRRNAPPIASVAALAQPKIAPRQNRASMARAGTMAVGSTGQAPNVEAARSRHLSIASDSSSTARSSSDGGSVETKRPGDSKRRSLGVGQLASLRPPSIAPRTNKAAMARGGVVSGAVSMPSARDEKENRPQQVASANLCPEKPKISSRPRTSSAKPHESRGTECARERVPVDFSNTPGHRRTQTFSLASLAPPKIEPRTNLAASRRLSIGGVGAATAQGNAGSGRSSALGIAGAGRPSSSMSSARPARPSSSAAPVVGHGKSSSVDGRLVRTEKASMRTKAAPPSAYRFAV